MTAYKKRIQLEQLRGQSRLVPKWRLRRRVEALQRMGHTLETINREAGLGLRWLHTALHMPGESVRVDRLAMVDGAYRRLAMVPGDSERVRARAIRLDYAPPLAWDNIDDKDASPVVVEKDCQSVEFIDDAIIIRFMQGDTTIAKAASQAEKRVIAQRWQASGRSMNDLARLTGWKPERYYEVSA